MTTKADWEFRSKFLTEQASYLERKSDELRNEAARYRGLAEQADYLARQTGEVAPATLTKGERT